jgi:putative transcription factor
VTARVEGVTMNVCRECSRFGTVLKTFVVPVKEKEQKKKEAATVEKKPEIVEVVVTDFPRRIRQAREKTGLKPEDFAKTIAEKESVVLHLEAGKMIPNLALAKKLERALHITLIERVEEKDEQLAPTSGGTMTLGDLIK